MLQVLDLTKDAGHLQAENKAWGERRVSAPQQNFSEVKKTDQQGINGECSLQILNIAKVEEEDQKLLEEVDREAIDSNLTMMMINEW